MTPYAADLTGPIFISYRWSDGEALAKDAARRLRASGVPVWLDRDDLPPGETDTRLKEALASGISGAVLVATPNVGVRKTPDAIHDMEAPLLLDSLAPQSDFTLVVLNPVEEAPGKVDRGAPDRFYFRTDVSPHTQYSGVDKSLDRMGRELAIDRMRRLRARRGTNALTIDLQTRVAGTAEAHAADLIFRSIPPVTGRVPTIEVFEDLQRFLAWLPGAVATERAPEVSLVGGAHLTVACAFGAALAQPSGIPLVVRATDGQQWRLAETGFSWKDRLPVFGKAPKARDLKWRGSGTAVGVLIDLVPTPAAPTFREYLDEHRDEFAQGVVIDSNVTLDSSGGPIVVGEVARLLRHLAIETRSELHVFLRTPWVAATLLGALTNTLKLTLYEWDNSVAPPRYERTITINPGVGGGPLTAVHPR